MIFRFSLQHDSFGTIEISEPLGWETAKLKLTRDDDYHSLVEEFDISATFYGDNGIHNGGISIIKVTEQIYGVDTELRLIIEMSFDEGVTYPLSFTGLLALEESDWNTLNQVTIPVIPDDIWTKFFSRKDTSVDVQSVEDLDGNPVNVIDPVFVELSPQKLRMRFLGYLDSIYRFDTDPGGLGLVPAGEYVQLDFVGTEHPGNIRNQVTGYPLDVYDEIEFKYNIPVALNPILPVWLFEAKYAGDYAFDIQILINRTTALIKAYLQINDDVFELTQTLVAANNYRYNYTDTHDLEVGDLIRIYIQNTDGSDRAITVQRIVNDGSNDLLTYFDVVADTVYPQTEAHGFLLHDAFAAIIDRIIEQDIFYSEVLGSDQTNAREYVNNGCFWNFAILKGLQLRNYTLDEKIFSLSFNECWNGANPIFNLGLGLETVTYESINDLSIPTLSTWITTVGANHEWTTGISNPIVNLPGGGGLSVAFSETLYSNFAFESGVEYTIEVDYAVVYNSQTSSTNDISLSITDNSLASQFQQLGTLPASGPSSISITFIATSTCTRIAITCASGRNIDVSITSVSGTSISQETGEFLRIEEKEHFYNQSSVSVYFDNVQEIKRIYDQEKIYNKITVGYKKWQSENISGIDDPQSKREYATRFSTIGTGIDLTSNFIAASLAIETTRRSASEKSKDYKFDNDTFIIALQNSLSPDNFIPALDEDFDSVSNLLNAETRYNLILTPMRILLRWSNVIMGALQQYLDSSFKFVGGEGNYDMISDYSCSAGEQCLGIICDPISESQDIPFSNPDYHLNFGYLHLHYQYDMTIDMSYEQYKAIRDNRNEAIGISQTDANHVKFFIKSLEYEIKKGEAKISAWPVTYMDLEVIEQTFTMQCAPSEEECENAITDELGDELTDELGVCITFV